MAPEPLPPAAAYPPAQSTQPEEVYLPEGQEAGQVGPSRTSVLN